MEGSSTSVHTFLLERKLLVLTCQKGEERTTVLKVFDKNTTKLGMYDKFKKKILFQSPLFTS
jgi:hypothetical protein